MIQSLCITLVLNIYTKQEAEIDIVALTLMYTPYTAMHVIATDMMLCSLLDEQLQNSRIHLHWCKYHLLSL